MVQASVREDSQDSIYQYSIYTYRHITASHNYAFVPSLPRDGIKHLKGMKGKQREFNDIFAVSLPVQPI